MDPLAWLGLRRANEGLAAIHDEVSRLLPDAEPAVVRYIVIVAALLTRIANADGRIVRSERKHLNGIMRHIDRMPADQIDAFCELLAERAPKLSDDELQVCYRQLRSLCDAEERVQVLRLLASQAGADGSIETSEHSELLSIAVALGIEQEQLEELELEAFDDSPFASERESSPPENAPED